MSKVDKLIARLQSEPTPSDFSYDELRKIMQHFGYLEGSKGRTSGSRVEFYNPHNKRVLLLHRPHGGDPMVRAAVRQTIAFLKDEGKI